MIQTKICFTKNELERVLKSNHFQPEKLIRVLEKQYHGTFKKDAGVWERYSLKQHTLMVMRQFEKYFGHSALPSDIDKNIFRLILALHDIGKPEAIEKKDKSLQHEYTPKHIKLLFNQIGIEKRYTNLACSLTSGDPIGGYLTNKINTSQAVNMIIGMSKTANIQINNFFELLCIYYKVDAGSYTKNAGGFESLDSLFNFNETDRCLDFAVHIRKKINKLKL